MGKQSGPSLPCRQADEIKHGCKLTFICQVLAGLVPEPACLKYAACFTSAKPVMTAPNSLILATMEHLSRFVPFGSMERDHLAWMAERLKLGYFASLG